MDLSESISDHPGSVRQIQAPPTSCGNTSVSRQTGCASKSELHQGRLLDGFRGQHVSLDSPGEQYDVLDPATGMAGTEPPLCNDRARALTRPVRVRSHSRGTLRVRSG